MGHCVIFCYWPLVKDKISRNLCVFAHGGREVRRVEKNPIKLINS